MTKLKTLQDMTLFFSDRLKLEEEFLDWARTRGVKVCPFSVIGWIQDEIRTRDKQSAINDIKELRAPIDKSSVFFEILGIYAVKPVIEYIKWKNNLTEEDLK